MNNTLFRLWTDSGWCTRDRLLGWEIPTLLRGTTQGIEGAREKLADILRSAPESVLQALWLMCVLKNPGSNRILVKSPGHLIGVRCTGADRLEVDMIGGYIELRLKFKQRSVSDQLDLLVEKVT